MFFGFIAKISNIISSGLQVPPGSGELHLRAGGREGGQARRHPPHHHRQHHQAHCRQAWVALGQKDGLADL